MKKRVLSLLMSFVMVISLLPATARAVETTATATVDFTAQAAGTFLLAPQFGVEVASNTAERYGYTDSVDGVSALDVLVKAHELMLGEEFFTAETAASFLALNSSGYISMLFGEETSNCSFTLNGGYPNDGTSSLYGGYNGTTVTTQEVTTGDKLEFFIYQDTQAQDLMTWLEQYGTATDTIKAKPGAEVKLTVKGLCYGWAGYLYKDAEALRAAGSVVKNAQLAWVNATTGELTDITGAVTNDKGSVTLTMPEIEGTYYLTAHATGEATPLILSLTKVVVDQNTPDAELCSLTALNVGDLESNPGFLTLSPAFSADVYEYSAPQVPYQQYAKMLYVKAAVASETSVITAELNHANEKTLTSGTQAFFNTMLPGQNNVLTITVTNGTASKTYTVTVPMADAAAPKLKANVSATATASVEKGSTYTLNLGTIFEKGSGDSSEASLTYKVKVDGAAETTLESAAYTNSTLAAGTHTLVFTAYNGALASPTHTVTLTVTDLAAQRLARMESLLKNIAAANTETTDEWWIMDMAAYTKLGLSNAATTAAAKQAYINETIAAVQNSTDSNTLSKAELILRSIGVDCTQLYPVNSNTAISVPAQLRALEMESRTIYETPWVLVTQMQGDLALTQAQIDTLVGILTAAQDNNTGIISTLWGSDVDTTATAVAALSPLCATNEAAQTFVTKALAGLREAQGTNGSYGNANTDAMAIIGFAAQGIDPTEVKKEGGASLLDGLLTYALADNSGFRPNDMATEQAFRALIAAKQVMTTGKPYNIYDFSANTLSPARATGGGAVTTPSAPTGDNIAVRVTVKADTGYWLNNKSVTIAGTGATVYHAFTAALEGTGITQVGAANGYVSSMTKDGRTLAEFTNGENSGWLYKVNGTLPTVGLTSQAIQNGDSIVFYYTNDWTLDPDAGRFHAPAQEATSTLAPAASAENGTATAAVSAAEMSAALNAAEKASETQITIAPEITGTAATLAVRLPLSAAANAAQQGMQLVIDTGAAQIALPADVLRALPESGGALEITISMQTAADLSGRLPYALPDNASIATVTISVGGEPITTFGGASLFVELPLDASAFSAGELCRILILSDDGSTERTTARCTEQNGKLIARVDTKHLSTFVATPIPALPFPDVAADAWYADAVQYVYETGLMDGMSAASFGPAATTTRAQIVTILYRMAGSPAAAEALPYTDTATDAWYADAIRWAAANKIVTGYADGTFRPNDTLTREQLATILYRYVQLQGGGFTGMWYFPLRYEDAGAISVWADEAMHWCVMQGILTGTGSTTLSPAGSANRAQLATILERFCTLSDTDTNTDPSPARAYGAAADYLAGAVSAPTVASIGGEWTVLALCRGSEGSDAQFDAYLSALEQTLRANDGVLSSRKYTEYSRVILALSALGEDARDFADYDLTAPLGDYDKAIAQGVNGAIFALLALDSADYPMPRNAEAATQATRQMYVNCILSAQRADGGWSLKADAAQADPDLTAMALQALSKYQQQAAVSKATNAALVCLSALQNADGGFSSSGAANAESCAQVLLALVELGIDSDDSRFVKNGCTALDALLTYQNTDGGFRHIQNGGTNLMATEQAACALAALVRAQNGQSSFYRMNETAAATAAA